MCCKYMALGCMLIAPMTKTPYFLHIMYNPFRLNMKNPIWTYAGRFCR